MSPSDKKKKKKKSNYEEDFLEKEETQGASLPVAAAIPMIIFFFVLGGLLGGFFLPLGKRGKAKKCPAPTVGTGVARGARSAGPQKRLKLRIPPDAPYVGPKDAPVSIIVFEDFECPWCKRATTVLDKVLKAFPKDVRFVLMNYPLARHKGAQIAAEAGIEAMAQGKFKQMKDKLFANSRAINKDNILKWGGEIGMDTNKLKASLDNKTHEKKVQSQFRLGKMVGVRGTPTILVNGLQFRMTRDMKATEANLRKMIKDELALIAKRRLPRGKAYAMLTRNGERTIQALTARGPRGRAGKNPRPRTRRVVDPSQVYKVKADFSKAAYKGAKKPLVTIVEFSDFQCPYCSRFEKTIAEVMEKYKEDVRVVFVNFPLHFHKQAMPAAIAAVEFLKQKGPSEAYWKFHDKIFANGRAITTENLAKWAGEFGADANKVKEAVTKKTHEAEIRNGMKLGQRFGVRGTPASFVNGRYVSGARPFKMYKPIIEREIAAAKKLIEAKKATRENVYDVAIAAGLDKAKYIEQKLPQRPKRRPRPRLDTTKTYRIDVNGLPFIGDPDASVVMAIGFDVQCPYCARIMAILEQLMDGDGKEFKGYAKGLKVVLLHYPLPFHKDANLAHQAIQEVFNQKGPKTLYAFLKLLKKDSRKLPRATLEKHAAAVGVDMAKFKAALDKGTHKALLSKTMANARNVGVMGTPAVYINGKSARGRSLPLFRKLITDAQKVADEYAKANPGVKGAKYYEAIMKTALPKAVWIQPNKGPGARPGAALPAIRKLRPGKRPVRPGTPPVRVVPRKLPPTKK